VPALARVNTGIPLPAPGGNHHCSFYHFPRFLTNYLSDELQPINEGNMRETSDLVNEMLTVAKEAWLVAIAVGFEDETKFVFSLGKQPLKELNQLVEKGGYPIGLLRFDKENSKIQGSYRPFREYENEEWVKKYLAGLLDNAGDIIALSQQKHKFSTAY
jgi:hypothetical protein